MPSDSRYEGNGTSNFLNVFGRHSPAIIGAIFIAFVVGFGTIMLELIRGMERLEHRTVTRDETIREMRLELAELRRSSMAALPTETAQRALQERDTRIGMLADRLRSLERDVKVLEARLEMQSRKHRADQFVEPKTSITKRPEMKSHQN